jgi:hypothetical protein
MRIQHGSELLSNDFNCLLGSHAADVCCHRVRLAATETYPARRDDSSRGNRTTTTTTTTTTVLTSTRAPDKRFHLETPEGPAAAGPQRPMTHISATCLQFTGGPSSSSSAHTPDARVPSSSTSRSICKRGSAANGAQCAWVPSTVGNNIEPLRRCYPGSGSASRGSDQQHAGPSTTLRAPSPQPESATRHSTSQRRQRFSV